MDGIDSLWEEVKMLRDRNAVLEREHRQFYAERNAARIENARLREELDNERQFVARINDRLGGMLALKEG